jgi:hypothetical protein
MNTQIKTWLGVTIIIVIAATAVVFAWKIQKQVGVLKSILPDKNTACTMEAKLCPDGSSVGRSGPNCEFAPCSIGGTMVGNDRDEHGCIGSAGYTWCEEKKKCLRSWEENCRSSDISKWKIYTNDEYKFEIKYPEGLAYSDLETRKIIEHNSVQKRVDFKINDQSNIIVYIWHKDVAPAYDSQDLKNYEKIVINGQKGLKGRDYGTAYFMETYLFGNNYTVQIEYSGTNNKINIDLYNKIISTFKFIS